MAFIRLRVRIKLSIGAYHCPTSSLPPEFLFVKDHDLDLKWSMELFKCCMHNEIANIRFMSAPAC